MGQDLLLYILLMSIYIGKDLEDRLEALETENASLRKYNEYHQVVHEIDHMSDLGQDLLLYILLTCNNYMIYFFTHRSTTERLLFQPLIV